MFEKKQTLRLDVIDFDRHAEGIEEGRSGRSKTIEEGRGTEPAQDGAAAEGWRREVCRCAEHLMARPDQDRGACWRQHGGPRCCLLARLAPYTLTAFARSPGAAQMNGGDQWVRQWGVLYDCAATSLPLEIAKKKDELAALEAEIAAAEGVQAAACQRVVARQN